MEPDRYFRIRRKHGKVYKAFELVGLLLDILIIVAVLFVVFIFGRPLLQEISWIDSPPESESKNERQRFTNSNPNRFDSHDLDAWREKAEQDRRELERSSGSGLSW